MVASPASSSWKTISTSRQVRIKRSLDLARADLRPVQDAAANSGATMVLGINEIDREFNGPTLFNTVLIIGPDATLLNRHRRVTPNQTRRAWFGDGRCLEIASRRYAGRANWIARREAICRLRAMRFMPGHRNLCRSHMGRGRKLDCHNASHRRGSRLLGDWHRHRDAGQRCSERARQALQAGRLDQ
jgi:hypothetical protein